MPREMQGHRAHGPATPPANGPSLARNITAFSRAPPPRLSTKARSRCCLAPTRSARTHTGTRRISVGSALPLPNGASRARCVAHLHRTTRHASVALHRQVGDRRQRPRGGEPFVQEGVECRQPLLRQREPGRPFRGRHQLPECRAWSAAITAVPRFQSPPPTAPKPLAIAVRRHGHAGGAVEALLDAAGRRCRTTPGCHLRAADQHRGMAGGKLRLRRLHPPPPASMPRPAGAAG